MQEGVAFSGTLPHEATTIAAEYYGAPPSLRFPPATLFRFEIPAHTNLWWWNLNGPDLIYFPDTTSESDTTRHILKSQDLKVK